MPADVTTAPAATARQAIGVIDTYLGPDREVRGLAGPYPQEALPPEVVTALVAEALGAETVKYVMCTEYPCIAIIPEAPLAAALQPLRDKGLDPLLVDVGHNQALLLPMAGWLDLPPELDNEESRAQQYVRAERAKLRAQALSNGLVALAKADDAVLDHQKAP